MTEVLIAGAGPVGLALGCFLAPTGVDVRIIDRLPEPNQLSKAVGIQSRTLELFERIGVADDVLAAGRRVHGVEIHRGDHRLASMTLDELPTRYPFVVDLPQPDTEALLAARLDALGVTVDGLADVAAPVACHRATPRSVG